jgi:SAM-dependent methyltransferase
MILMILPSKVHMIRGRRLPLRTPVFQVVNQELRIVDFLRHFSDCLHWSVIKITDDGFVMRHYRDVLELTPSYFNTAFREWPLWLKYYLPNFPLDGKVVLDVGAGCGETAHFYFLKGAAKIIAVESDPSAVALLKKNAKQNKWNLEIIEEKFGLRHLDIPHDFMKMDIEGDEAMLLDTSRSVIKPCVIEVHSKLLIQRLKEKYMMTTLYKMASGIALLGLQSGPQETWAKTSRFELP